MIEQYNYCIRKIHDKKWPQVINKVFIMELSNAKVIGKRKKKD